MGAQAFGQNKITLQCPALPIPPDGIAQHKLQLGPIKRTLTWV